MGLAKRVLKELHEAREMLRESDEDFGKLAREKQQVILQAREWKARTRILARKRDIAVANAKTFAEELDEKKSVLSQAKREIGRMRAVPVSTGADVGLLADCRRVASECCDEALMQRIDAAIAAAEPVDAVPGTPEPAGMAALLELRRERDELREALDQTTIERDQAQSARDAAVARDEELNSRVAHLQEQAGQYRETIRDLRSRLPKGTVSHQYGDDATLESREVRYSVGEIQHSEKGHLIGYGVWDHLKGEWWESYYATGEQTLDDCQAHCIVDMERLNRDEAGKANRGGQ